MKFLFPVCAFLFCSLTSCVNGKVNPQVAQALSAIDTTGCELVTVYVKDQEAGDICDRASNLFNFVLANASAPAASATKSTEKPKKYPVKYQGVTVGHFLKPYATLVQEKLDTLSTDKARELTQ